MTTLSKNGKGTVVRRLHPWALCVGHQALSSAARHESEASTWLDSPCIVPGSKIYHSVGPLSTLVLVSLALLPGGVWVRQ